MKYFLGFGIEVLGWATIWSQVPEGMFSKPGAIVFIGITLVSVGGGLFSWGKSC